MVLISKALYIGLKILMGSVGVASLVGLGIEAIKVYKERWEL